jgi:hypothetical protein
LYYTVAIEYNRPDDGKYSIKNKEIKKSGMRSRKRFIKFFTKKQVVKYQKQTHTNHKKGKQFVCVQKVIPSFVKGKTKQDVKEG